MRVRLLITLAVGFGLILAGAIETDIHHRTKGQAALSQKGSVPEVRVVEPQILPRSSPTN
jgi:hypothetical protein